MCVSKTKTKKKKKKRRRTREREGRSGLRSESAGWKGVEGGAKGEA